MVTYIPQHPSPNSVACPQPIHAAGAKRAFPTSPGPHNHPLARPLRLRPSSPIADPTALTARIPSAKLLNAGAAFMAVASRTALLTTSDRRRGSLRALKSCGAAAATLSILTAPTLSSAQTGTRGKKKRREKARCMLSVASPDLRDKSREGLVYLQRERSHIRKLLL